MYHRFWCYLVAHPEQAPPSSAVRFRVPELKLVGMGLIPRVFPQKNGFYFIRCQCVASSIHFLWRKSAQCESRRLESADLLVFHCPSGYWSGVP